MITAGETTAAPTAMATRNEGVEASQEEAQGEVSHRAAKAI